MGWEALNAPPGASDPRRVSFSIAPQNIQNLWREPARSMDIPEFVSICRTNINPKFWTVGLMQSRAVEEARKSLNAPSQATVYFAPFAKGLWEQGVIVPKVLGGMPYATIVERAWNEEKLRWDTSPIKGWRALLRDLVSTGFLIPSRKLDYLLGEDTYKLFTDKYLSELR